IPFAIAIEALCARGVAWSEPRRYAAFLSGASLFVGWLVLLRSLVWLTTPVWLLWVAIAVTVIVPFLLERRLTRYGAAAQPAVAADSPSDSPAPSATLDAVSA
ncbi:MAG: hypothetical protein NTY38_10430, partial [Acidobacteria bacterium]|nr:hypothetical protein [Acidobacteriota bacterium]